MKEQTHYTYYEKTLRSKTRQLLRSPSLHTTRKKANVDIFFVDLRLYMSLYIDLTNNNDFYNLYVSNHDTYVNSYW